MAGDLDVLSAGDQLREVGARALDPRPTLPTGWGRLDSFLHRGGFAPGEFVILAGRTGTRKTTVMSNLIVNQLEAGFRVALVGLDESPANYAGKVMSVVTDFPREELENEWQTPPVRALRRGYQKSAANLVMSKGYRPTFEGLTDWLTEAEGELGDKVDVVYIDYVSLLDRDRYAGAEVQRIGRLVEEIQVWTNERQVVTVALHQVGRFNEGTGGRYHGDTRMSIAGMKYGGEEVADYVLATYRPANDPVGHMSLDDAFSHFPQGWSAAKVTDAWTRAQDRVRKYEKSTFLQLLKNRPGTDLYEEGIELVSPSRSMKMVEAGPKLDGMKLRRDE